jgi:hypothetical protein
MKRNMPVLSYYAKKHKCFFVTKSLNFKGHEGKGKKERIKSGFS